MVNIKECGEKNEAEESFVASEFGETRSSEDSGSQKSQGSEEGLDTSESIESVKSQNTSETEYSTVSEGHDTESGGGDTDEGTTEEKAEAEADDDAETGEGAEADDDAETGEGAEADDDAETGESAEADDDDAETGEGAEADDDAETGEGAEAEDATENENAGSDGREETTTTDDTQVVSSTTEDIPGSQQDDDIENLGAVGGVNVREPVASPSGHSGDLKWKHLGVFSKDICCILCTEMFDKDKRIPKILPCGHNVCAKCLSSENVRIMSCMTCNKDISMYKHSQFYTNHGLVDMMNKILKERVRSTILKEEIKGTEDLFYRCIRGTTEHEKDEHYLNAISRMEKETIIKCNLINFLLDTFNEKFALLREVREDLLAFVPELVNLKNELVRSKNLAEISFNLSKVANHIRGYNKTAFKYRQCTMDGPLHVQSGLLDLLNVDLHAMDVVEDELRYMLNVNVKYHFYTEIEEKSRERRLYAKMDLEEGKLHIYSFQETFPNTVSLFLKIEGQISRRLSRLFVEIVHKDSSQGMNPNRIYITAENTDCATRFTKFFYGSDGRSFKGADVENSPDYISVKHYLVNKKVVMDKSFLEGDEHPSPSAIKPGSLVVQAVDRNAMFKILRKVQVTKKSKYILIGQISSGIRELSKIKGDCYIENCGIVII